MDIADALNVLDEASEMLDGVVTELPPRRWLRPTPARGWSIASQIGHLAWSDEMALRAVRKDPEFGVLLTKVAAGGGGGIVDRGARELAALPTSRLLATWRARRQQLHDELRGADQSARIAWLGPSVLPRTMVIARTVETWAHGFDVFDALAQEMPAGGGLEAVVKMGVRTRESSFAARKIPLPAAPVRVELDAPGGRMLAYGPGDARERVTGSAWGFAAVVTQRRNVLDVELEVVGDGAARWMRIAQAFGGAPTNGPAPGVRLEWHR